MVRIAASALCPCLSADQTPSGNAIAIADSSEIEASRRDVEKPGRISELTGRLSVVEMPISPRMAERAQ
jgi:hypothetical protein